MLTASACTQAQQSRVCAVNKLPISLNYDGVKAAINGDKAAKKVVQKYWPILKTNKTALCLMGFMCFMFTSIRQLN